MNTFQLIVIPVFAVLFLERIWAALRNRATRRMASLWAAVWLAAAVAVARPGLTEAIAQPLGIRRGADLVFYCAIMVMFVGFFMVYVRMRRMEVNLTRLVRQMAIQQALLPDREKGGQAYLSTDPGPAVSKPDPLSPA